MLTSFPRCCNTERRHLQHGLMSCIFIQPRSQPSGLSSSCKATQCQAALSHLLNTTGSRGHGVGRLKRLFTLSFLPDD